MIAHFTEGFVIGLGMIVFIGPVFFLLLSSTLNFGQVAGFLVALGIIISDVCCVTVIQLGLAPYLTNHDTQKIVAFFGGILLLSIGMKYLFSKAKMAELKVIKDPKIYFSFVIKGFLVNGVNPFVWMVWIGLVQYKEEHAPHASVSESFSFLTGILVGILFLDLLKVFLAQRIQGFIQPHTLQKIYQIFGIVLIAFGLRMFWYVFF